MRAHEVRLVDETGSQMGIIPIADALKAAEEKGLDLIQVTEKVDPPVCRIGDYGKYLYQQEKKGREGKKQTGGELKEVRLTYTMSPHDMETRAKRAEKFLSRGSKVRVTLPLRGRQRALEGYAREKLTTFINSLKEIIPIKIEREIKREPRGLSILITKG
ncbi:MAG: translation initiation factor IF-3 [Patescibacteria group bacterium]|nr:translation initiation factor IF-3 [Patescibacteria group bacterium]